MGLYKYIDRDRWFEKIIYYNCRLNKKGRAGSLLSWFFHVFIRLFFPCDIIPDATIGRGVKFAHAVGIVIGATAVVGDNCVIMPNVVLGAKHYPPKRGKRHPTIGKGCLIGANATVLGDITVGDNCTVGAGTVLTESIPNGTTVTGAKFVIRSKVQ